MYREICHNLGAGLTYTEMISDKGLLYDNARTKRMIEVDDFEPKRKDWIKTTVKI